MRSLVLPLSIQYLPSSHGPAFLFCPASLAHGMDTLYCTFTLKEKDTLFPLSRLQDSTINPVASILPSPFVLLFSWIKGGVLSSCCLADTASSPLPVNSPLLLPSSSWAWGWVPRWYLGTVARGWAGCQVDEQLLGAVPGARQQVQCSCVHALPLSPFPSKWGSGVSRGLCKRLSRARSANYNKAIYHMIWESWSFHHRDLEVFSLLFYQQVWEFIQASHKGWNLCWSGFHNLPDLVNLIC